jgi:outer membrane lipoprotein-sorting protein
VALLRLGGLLVVLIRCLAIQDPSGEEVLSRVENGLKGIEDYTVQLQATVDMERLQMPMMAATMYFKAPDKIHFESTSFAMLPREGLALNPGDLRRRFESDVLGKDTLTGRPTYVVRLRPRTDEVTRKSVMLWVDLSRWVVMQMRTEPFEGRRLVAKFTYVHVDDRFWLPETLVASFETVSAPPEGGGVAVPEVAPETRRQARPPREGTITVVYSEYRVNTGLSDELFDKRKDEL